MRGYMINLKAGFINFFLGMKKNFLDTLKKLYIKGSLFKKAQGGKLSQEQEMLADFNYQKTRIK